MNSLCIAPPLSLCLCYHRVPALISLFVYCFMFVVLAILCPPFYVVCLFSYFACLFD